MSALQKVFCRAWRLAVSARGLGSVARETFISGRLTFFLYGAGCLGVGGKPGSDLGDAPDVGDVDVVVGIGEGVGERLGEDAGVGALEEPEHVLGAPDEVQSNSYSSPESRFRSLTPATASISRHFHVQV